MAAATSPESKTSLSNGAPASPAISAAGSDADSALLISASAMAAAMSVGASSGSHSLASAKHELCNNGVTRRSYQFAKCVMQELATIKLEADPAYPTLPTCIVFGGALRDQMRHDVVAREFYERVSTDVTHDGNYKYGHRDLLDRFIVPNDIDVLTTVTRSDDIIEALRKNLSVNVISEKRGYIKPSITVRKCVVSMKPIFHPLVGSATKCRIMLDLVCCTAPFAHYSHHMSDFDYDVNTLYMVNDGINTFMTSSSSNTFNKSAILHDVISNVHNKRAMYIGRTYDSSFDLFKKERKITFLRSLALVMRGWAIDTLPFTIRDAVTASDGTDEACPICYTTFVYKFVQMKCCKGFCCAGCFETHVREELKNRIRYRCMFHHDEATGFHSVTGCAGCF